MNALQDKLDTKYKNAKEEYLALQSLKRQAAFALSTIPEEFFEDALDYGYSVFMFGKNSMEFDVKFPYSKRVIRETYKIIRKAGWKKRSDYSWEQSFEITFELPGTEFTLEATYKFDTPAATCVKIPTKVKETPSVRTSIVEAEIYCSDDHPELFEEDADGNMVFIGETPDPEVIEEDA